MVKLACSDRNDPNSISLAPSRVLWTEHSIASAVEAGVFQNDATGLKNETKLRVYIPARAEKRVSIHQIEEPEDDEHLIVWYQNCCT